MLNFCTTFFIHLARFDLLVQVWVHCGGAVVDSHFNRPDPFDQPLVLLAMPSGFAHLINTQLRSSIHFGLRLVGGLVSRAGVAQLLAVLPQ